MRYQQTASFGKRYFYVESVTQPSQAMQVTDVLYGTASVAPVVAELLVLPALQRLGRIHQGGGVFLVTPALQHTRLEHSIGVMLLLRRLGASEFEQVAGLVHDVSHTAFSHVVDYVLGNAAEDYHEQILEQVVATSGLAPVLQRYGYHLADILSATFPLLEQPLPRLCADRLDYTLRDLFYAGMLSHSEIQAFLATLTVTGNRIVVTSAAAARWIQHQYARLVNEFFHRPDLVFANHTLATILQQAIQAGVLSEADFLRDDQQVLDALQQAGPPFTTALADLRQLKGLALFKPAQVVATHKSRWLDPDILLPDTVQPLSHYQRPGEQATNGPNAAST